MEPERMWREDDAAVLYKLTLIVHYRTPLLQLSCSSYNYMQLVQSCGYKRGT